MNGWKIRGLQHLYTFAMYLLTPFILNRLLWRSIRAPGYRLRWKERFGYITEPSSYGGIWIHAVSLGEVNAAVPLIRALIEKYPNRQFIVTTVTPTGSDRVKQVFGSTVFHVYLPYDLPSAVNRFLDRVQPSMAVVMETEIWPNLYYACGERDLPLFLANARLSRQSEAAYKPIRYLVSMALQCVWGVAAQADADAIRLMNLGAFHERVRMVNSLKFDIDIEQETIELGNKFRTEVFGTRPVWLAASTHEGDEEPVLEAHKKLLDLFPDLLLVLVPRHPERFDRAHDLCHKVGVSTVLRSQNVEVCQATQCYLGDTLGELLMLYQAADIAFVGGSLSDVGGHNVLEPAALAKPVLFGPNISNFDEICTSLLEGKGAMQVRDGGELYSQMVELLNDKDLVKSTGRKAAQVVLDQRGAVGLTLALIDEFTADGKPCIKY